MTSEGRFSLRAIRSDKVGQPTQWRIAISRKVARLATRRNRWKRRIREILRQRRETIRPGHQVTLKINSVAGSLTPAELEKEILELLEKAKLISKK